MKIECIYCNHICTMYIVHTSKVDVTYVIIIARNVQLPRLIISFFKVLKVGLPNENEIDSCTLFYNCLTVT